MGHRVAIVGGGLAGITAALDCAAGGAEVSLLEVRPRLGGAAYSFQRDGLCLDNGQHVFLRCCVAYRALLGQLRGRLRFAVAAFVAGGEAALDAIERAGYEVRLEAPRATRVRRALSLAAELTGRHHAADERSRAEPRRDRSLRVL